jgi:hypothetical protein
MIGNRARRRIVSFQQVDDIIQRARQILDHRSHQRRLQTRRRAEMMQHIGVRHADCFADVGKRHGTRTAVKQQTTRRDQPFFAYLRARSLAAFRGGPRHLVHSRHRSFLHLRSTWP